MASVFKKSYTHTDSKTGKKELRYNAKWYVKYKDADDITRCVPGFKDKAATHELAAKLEREAELGRRGIIDPYEKHRKTPIAKHLEDFQQHLMDKNNSEKHIALIVGRVQVVIDFCGFVYFTNVSASDVQRFLGNIRSNGRSVETRNHYLSAFKQFCRWLVTERRVSDNPVSHLKKENSKVDRRHDRRALTDDEFRRLVEAAENGPNIESVNGPDRAIIYIMAAWTGFRRAELASLTLRSFRLDGEHPTVRLNAADSKNRKGGELPLHPVVVERLQAWLSECPTIDHNIPLFPLKTNSGKNFRKTAKMMKRDLAAAREKWLKEAEADEAELARREASDFLAYCDEDGLFADFHANRHTFISNLGRAGVPLATAQKLARHSDPKLTANVYTHLGIQEQADAVRDLPVPPVFGLASPQRTTYGLHVQEHVHTSRETSHDMSSIGEIEWTQPSHRNPSFGHKLSPVGKSSPAKSQDACIIPANSESLTSEPGG